MRCKYEFLIGILEKKYPALALKVKNKLMFNHMHMLVDTADQYVVAHKDNTPTPM